MKLNTTDYINDNQCITTLYVVDIMTKFKQFCRLITFLNKRTKIYNSTTKCG